VGSRIVDEITSPTLAYRSTHELLRRALYDRLTAVRRAELHLQVGTALEDSGAVMSGRALAEVAYHLAAAGSLGDASRASGDDGARLRAGRRLSSDRARPRHREPRRACAGPAGARGCLGLRRPRS